MQKAFLALVLVVSIFVAPGSAFAVRLYLDPETQEVPRLDTFYVPIRIDADGECINAVSGRLYYDPNELAVVDIITAESIFTLWTEGPLVLREGDKEKGEVVFEGGVPGGYCGRVLGDPGRTDTVAKLVVQGTPQPLPVGERTRTELVMDPGTAVYLHDGTGRQASTTVTGIDLTLIQATGTPSNVWLNDVQNDTVAPELFEVTLVEGPSVGNNRHYIVFSTTDKQSGIDHYEVKETDPDRFGFLTWLPERTSYWVVAESPYILRDQKLTSKILVKAVDKNGNERVVTYTPPMSPLEELTNMRVLIPLVLLVVLVMGAAAGGAWLYRRTRERGSRRSAQIQDNASDHSDDSAGSYEDTD